MEIRLLADLVEHRGTDPHPQRSAQRGLGLQPARDDANPVIHIARLRAKLGEAAELIETVYGAGYRLSARYPVVHQTP